MFRFCRPAAAVVIRARQTPRPGVEWLPGRPNGERYREIIDALTLSRESDHLGNRVTGQIASDDAECDAGVAGERRQHEGDQEQGYDHLDSAGGFGRRCLTGALKLRRQAFMFTNAILPQMTGAVSFRRVLDGALHSPSSGLTAPHLYLHKRNSTTSLLLDLPPHLHDVSNRITRNPC